MACTCICKIDILSFSYTYFTFYSKLDKCLYRKHISNSNSKQVLMTMLSQCSITVTNCGRENTS